MEGAIIARCRFDSKTVAIPVFNSFSYMELCNQISSRFSELVSGHFELTYSIGNHPSCLLQSDLDVQVLHISLSNENKRAVDIDVNVLGVGNIASEQHEKDLDDEESNGCCSEDENEFLGKYATPVGKTYFSHECKTYIHSVGQKFEGGVREFRSKLCMYAIEKGFRFVYKKNEKDRVTAECFMKHSEHCNWHIHARSNYANGFFYIKTLNNVHTCKGRLRGRKSFLMGSKIVSTVVAEQIRSKPLVRPIDIVHGFKQNYGLDISYYNAWKGKEMAQIQVHGDEALSYKQLVWYVDALKETNKGSHCVLECDESSSRFKRLFLSFNASIEGFKHCRPFLCLDGTHIKNKYKGHLLAATGKNGNQGIYPLAYAIVDSENEENWTWFLQILHKILEPQDRTITFISDRCKGLLPSVRNVFPNSPHAFCLYHLKNNITSKYPYSMGKGFRNWIVTCFQNCAYAPDINHFELHMSKLTKDGGETIDSFLEDAPKENWSNAFFPGKKYGEMCSNVAESFNSWIQAERELPVYQLVDRLRIKLMVSYSARLRASNKWTTSLCPKMEKRLNKSYEAGRHWDVSRSNDYLFEVHDAFAYSVDLKIILVRVMNGKSKGFRVHMQLQPL